MPKLKGKGGLRATRDTEAMQVTITRVDSDGKALESRNFDRADLGEKVQPESDLYGLQKLLMDRTSDAELNDKLGEMDTVFEQLVADVWAKERVVGSPVASIAIEALAKFKSSTIPSVQKSLSGYTKEQRAEILANPKLDSFKKDIEKAREAAKDSDLGDLLK